MRIVCLQRLLCRNEDLLGHILEHIEGYSKDLEEKTLELDEERGKVNALLYRMLPRYECLFAQVALVLELFSAK